VYKIKKSLIQNDWIKDDLIVVPPYIRKSLTRFASKRFEKRMRLTLAHENIYCFSMSSSEMCFIFTYRHSHHTRRLSNYKLKITLLFVAIKY